MLYVLLSEMLSRTLVMKKEDAKEDNQIEFFIIHQNKCARLVTDITSRCQMSPMPPHHVRPPLGLTQPTHDDA